MFVGQRRGLTAMSTSRFMEGLLRAILLSLGVSGCPAWTAPCIDVAADRVLISGRLAHRSFDDSGAAQVSINRDVGEAAYLLELAAPTCFFGDQFLGGEVTISEVHLMIDAEEDHYLFGQLRALVGKDVAVSGKRAFGAHSPHHRAPVVVVVETVRGTRPPGQDTARRAVETFYLALEVGNGSAAAEKIIPSKRRSGPLSGAAMSRFYGSLKEPLELLDVVDLGADRFRAFYRFETAAGSRCNGSAIVTTTSVGGAQLISRIIAERGC
jgi:hypothetical protein